MNANVLNQDILSVLHMQGAPPLVLPEVRSADVADRQPVVAEVRVGGLHSHFAVLYVYAVNDDVAVDHPLAAVVLHVNGVMA